MALENDEMMLHLQRLHKGIKDHSSCVWYVSAHKLLCMHPHSSNQKLQHEVTAQHGQRIVRVKCYQNKLFQLWHGLIGQPKHKPFLHNCPSQQFYMNALWPRIKYFAHLWFNSNINRFVGKPYTMEYNFFTCLSHGKMQASFPVMLSTFTPYHNTTWKQMQIRV
jgi:hypothetical protein